MDSLKYAKIPPHSKEAENALLGAIMLQGRNGTEIAMGITDNSDMFYTPTNQIVYKSVLDLYKSGAAVDPITVTNDLNKKNLLEQIGTAYYLAQLTNDVMLFHADIASYAAVVKEHFLSREIIRICGEAITHAYNGEPPVELVNHLAAQFNKIGDVGDNDRPAHIADVVTKEFMSISERRAANVVFSGVPTGFPTLDKLTGGWQDTDFIIIAARPAVGKTAFTLNLAINAGQALQRDINVAFFSLEMSKGQLGKRALAIKSGVLLSKIYRDVIHLNETDMKDMEKAIGELKSCKLFINDRAAVTPAYIKRVCSDLERRHGLDMIVIDYLQLMRPNFSEKSRERDVASISRDLKELAKEMGVPVIALSQLNRQGTGEPDLSNLRESGAIEQDADLVAFLYGDEAENQSSIILKVAKHRNGASDKVPFTFDKEKQKFIDVSAPNEFERSPYAGIRNNGGLYPIGDKPFG